MKLIIDISENSYKTCKSLAPLTNEYISNVIANGTPVSNEGNLISRSELKKAFNKWWGCDDIPATVVEELIDDTPTAEPEPTKSTWRKVTDDKNVLWFRCMNCRRTSYIKSKYCPECGAFMEGCAE